MALILFFSLPHEVGPRPSLNYTILDVVHGDSKLRPHMRHNLVVRGEFTHWFWHFSFLFIRFSFICVFCGRAFDMFYHRKVFLCFSLFLSMIRILFCLCCCRPGWFYEIWNTLCFRTTCLHSRWCAAVAHPSIPHRYASTGYPKSSRQFSFSFPTLSGVLQTLLYYLMLVVAMSLSFLHLCPVWTFTAHLETTHQIDFSSVKFFFLALVSVLNLLATSTGYTLFQLCFRFLALWVAQAEVDCT